MKRKNSLNNKDLQKMQQRFIQTLEGIGDILVVETQRKNRNKIVLYGLKEIVEITEEFLRIQRDDPDKFERLLLAQDYFELYNKDEKNAKFRLALDPQKYLISFSTALNQLTRIHEAALEVKNDEISRFATYHLNWILAHLTQTPNNELFVQQLFENLAGVTRRAIENQDSSMYAASVHWYIDIVFNRLGKAKGKFDLSYLDSFDKHFFANAMYIISKDQKHIFQSLVSFLVDGVHIPSHDKGKVWEYGHILLDSDFEKYRKLESDYQLEKRLKELAGNESELDTRANLSEWLKKFEELKRILEPHFNETQQQNAQAIETAVRNFADKQFKHNNLLNIIFAICAFCLFKKRPEYIRQVWEYNQPPDADGMWIGQDIIPNTINDAVNLYFRKGLFERHLDFWEGHHGSERYYKQTFLLFLAHALYPIRETPDGKYVEIANYGLPELSIYRLSDIEYSIEGLIKIAIELQTQTETLEALGFDLLKTDHLFAKKLIPFLETLRRKAQERIQSIEVNQQISQKKVDEFKTKLVEGFNQVATVRSILKYYKLYEDRTSEKYEGQPQRFGIRTTDDKALFFDEWHVHYVDQGSSYGHGIATSEDKDILSHITEQCENIERSSLQDIITELKGISDIIVITEHSDIPKFYKYPGQFKPKWQTDVKKLEITGFEGWYSFNNRDIPIFGVGRSTSSAPMLLLRTSKLGKLIQHSPLNKDDNEKLVNDIFYINIESFSERQELIEEFIKEPPEWLKEIGDEQKQREYLQKRVLLNIAERFEYQKNDDFQGYKFQRADSPLSE